MKPYEIITTADDKEILVSCGTCDRLRLRRHVWKVGSHRYPYTYIGHTVLIHRLIMGVKTGQQVDHINGNPLDNRDENLRLCTPGQNAMNKRARKGIAAGFKGVFWSSGKWQAAIKMQGVRYHLGRFDQKERAAKAYDRAALALAGEFAALNFEDCRATYRPKMPTPCRPRPVPAKFRRRIF